MNTNAGSKTLDQEGDVIGFGRAWFDEEGQMANIFGFATTVDRYQSYI